ncbi:conserved hypothetical protein [Talaromyces stipitatus ATCC 10500]|uniref:Uncharacterized protein n=1 Tax=Talaromyces stipitatus (strain ATCC 10500 / CBS 375.48 / QM 6759 / NRRL 1006) TaxID=441959 RepID=B8MH23_TALSN|nr:uncharacterized protein TSTA_019010 [Talaromyces stipitatus ATCC 10500]EED16837.1 conserved hypothetical protein [Talaromyces stipitatus ATCC 10500]
MVFSSDQPSVVSAGQEVEVVDDCDEPPDQNRLHNRPNNDQIYIKSPPLVAEKKESLLTRALKSPEIPPVDRTRKASYPMSNGSGHSTAELTSDGDLTSPAYSNTSSPPHVSTLHLAPVLESRTASPPADPNESKIEADLGRKRCISFACTARQPVRPKEVEKQKTEDSDATNPPQRKSRRCQSYTSRTNRSPPPTCRRSSADSKQADATPIRATEPAPVKKPGSIHMPGLGDFQPSEETRFHEFASSLEEVDGWVAQATEHQGKITVADCMKKEMAIRKLGEEAEAEAIAEEEEEDEMDNGDEDDTVDLDDEEEDADTVHDFSSDDGNESDNEAGFADSDDESDDNSEYEFWAPSTTTAATSADNMDIIRLAVDRRNSTTSIESLKHEYSRPPSSMAGSKGKSRRPINIPRAQTPDLPDSTDFVCGTLDEDRPLEAAYISCIEERRRKKHIPVPQDIDPSFPTTDPEDNDDDLEENEDDAEDDEVATAARIEEDLLRGRSKGTLKKKTTRASPRRVHSPAPRAHGQVSPKRMKSPAPKPRHALAAGLPTISIPVPRTGVNITGPVQRPHYGRTKSLPRTPNPFFTGLEESRQPIQQASPSGKSIDGPSSRSRELHTRGPIDIIQGLERKRQKRKEKFWRQHCRKAAAKEQSERRAARGKGAERMKELGLEVAERFKAYGVTKDTQLMLSV